MSTGRVDRRGHLPMGGGAPRPLLIGDLFGKSSLFCILVVFPDGHLLLLFSYNCLDEADVEGVVGFLTGVDRFGAPVVFLFLPACHRPWSSGPANSWSGFKTLEFLTPLVRGSLSWPS